MQVEASTRKRSITPGPAPKNGVYSIDLKYKPHITVLPVNVTSRPSIKSNSGSKNMQIVLEKSK
jgi:hypothetical protein